MITLYYTPETRAHRVRWLLEELQLDYQLIYIKLFEGEANTAAYRELHPLGQVPVLKDGPDVMFESGAICHYLADKYGKHLIPQQSNHDYMQYLQWLFFITSTLEPPLWEIHLHSWILPKPDRQRSAIRLASQRYQPIVQLVSDQLADQRPYFLGEQFSTVDILLASTLAWHQPSLKHDGILRNYVERLFAREACQRARADPEEIAAS